MVLRVIVVFGGCNFEVKLVGGYVIVSLGVDVICKCLVLLISKKVDKAEAEALKRREVARARVEERMKKLFGLG